MGSSQSKFKPEPNDVWYRIKVSASQPKFLQSVLQAIVNLKEPHGSSQGRIIDYIQSIINSQQVRPRPRNVAMQIKSALKYALRKRLIKQQGGKFVVALTDKEYAIFKGFRDDNPINKDVKTHRRRSKSKRKIKRSSRRRTRETDGLCKDDEYVDCIRPKKRKKYHDFEYESDDTSDFDLFSIPSASTSEETVKKSDSYIKKKREFIKESTSDHSKIRNAGTSRDCPKNDESKVVGTASTVRDTKSKSEDYASTSKFKGTGTSSNKGK